LENTLYIWKYFVLNIRADSPRPQTFCSPTAMIQPHPRKKIFLRNLVKFEQVWLDLCEIKVKFGKIWAKVIRFAQI